MPGLFLLLCAQGTQAHGVAIAIIPQYDILYHLKMNYLLSQTIWCDTGLADTGRIDGHRGNALRYVHCFFTSFEKVFHGLGWAWNCESLAVLSINVGEWSSWSAPSVVVPPPSSHLFGNQSSETGYEYFISLNLSSEYTVKHSHYKSVQIRWTKNISADTVAFSPPMQLIMLKQ